MAVGAAEDETVLYLWLLSLQLLVFGDDGIEELELVIAVIDLVFLLAWLTLFLLLRNLMMFIVLVGIIIFIVSDVS